MPCQPRLDLPGVARHLRGKYTLTLVLHVVRSASGLPGVGTSKRARGDRRFKRRLPLAPLFGWRLTALRLPRGSGPRVPLPLAAWFSAYRAVVSSITCAPTWSRMPRAARAAV